LKVKKEKDVTPRPGSGQAPDTEGTKGTEKKLKVESKDGRTKT